MIAAAGKSDEFLGFTRSDGRPGIRNHLAIVSLSGLEEPIARQVAARMPDCVLVSTLYGRGHIGEDRRFQHHMMRALATHPNVGGAVVLGPDRGLTGPVCEALRAAGRPTEGVALDEVGEDGFALADRATRAAAGIRHIVSRDVRVACQISDLMVAVECGHSGASSGIVANPLVGDFATALVAAGGRVLFSETLEWTGAEEVLGARSATPQIAQEIRAAIAWRHGLAKAAGHQLGQGNPGPQNHAGGITTLEEKSLGAVAKGGDQPIVGVLREGQSPSMTAGLYLMDTPCFSPESITSMIAAGAQLVLFTTDQGNPYSSALSPTLKITANPQTASLAGQIDFDASPAFLGTALRSDLVPRLADLVGVTASGALTRAEAACVGAESISRLGPSI